MTTTRIKVDFICFVPFTEDPIFPVPSAKAARGGIGDHGGVGCWAWDEGLTVESVTESYPPVEVHAHMFVYNHHAFLFYFGAQV